MLNEANIIIRGDKLTKFLTLPPPPENLNLRIKTEPFPVGAHTKVYMTGFWARYTV